MEDGSVHRLVLISGVNGYIAAVTAKQFLDNGYSVRGTVRKLSSAQPLIEGPLKSHAQSGHFTVVEVPDITVDGAFDEAVKGVTAIAHMASPVSFNFTDPVPILHAAIHGTKTLLTSAYTHAGPTLKTIVLISSIAAIRNQTPAPYTFSETDWNDYAESEVQRLGTDTPGPVIYSASKTASEKAFWEFRDTVHPSFTMTAINPVFVIGPPLIAPATPAAVGETVQSIWDVFRGAAPAASPVVLSSTVDVRDVARLMVYPVEHAQATDGERYIASSATQHPQAIADILRKAMPEARGRIEEGTPGVGYREDWQADGKNGYAVDNRKAGRLLGGWIPFDESVVDTAKSFVGLV
ncbi:NAD(P)-binding protein [Polyplosphaeria fusca]|uniref:NAD(P)-binding protein n=1 Tax=Polyplosphaeria fusca TaxID=682080 RepID=A0A9P4R6W5_9PLEO|nr:NAD(P)-binding protein [Polyplosphaeria fusca]